MAIWQYTLILLPEGALLNRYNTLPSAIPMELAEDFNWWSGVQPPAGFERQIDMILPRMESWSPEMRVWGQKHGDSAYVCYVDEKKTTVQEIGFRLDARDPSLNLVHPICIFAKQLGCVLRSSDYEILPPDDSVLVATIHDSLARKFVLDPVHALRTLDQTKIQKRVDHIMGDLGGPDSGGTDET